MIIATQDTKKQFIRSIYEYCFSIMEHIHGYFITPSNPLDVSNIFTCCTFSHVKIISSAFHIFPISHIQSYYIMKTHNDCFHKGSIELFIFNFQTEIVTFYPKHIIIQWIYGLIDGMSRHHRLSLMNYNIF